MAKFITVTHSSGNPRTINVRHIIEYFPYESGTANSQISYGRSTITLMDTVEDITRKLSELGNAVGDK